MATQALSKPQEVVTWLESLPKEQQSVLVIFRSDGVDLNTDILF